MTTVSKKEKIGRASDEYKEGMLQALRSNFRQVSNVSLQTGVDTDGVILFQKNTTHVWLMGLTEENIFRAHWGRP